jgi:GNAT superfamily N-acetyltransferase
MSIRNAIRTDAGAITALLDELGYRTPETLTENKIELLSQRDDCGIYVYETQGQLVGMIVIHFIPQLAMEGDFMQIGYFAVRHDWHGKGIGKQMEAYCADLARQRNCNRIIVHCHERRKDAHQFYYKQGFEESPKYLMKLL